MPKANAKDVYYFSDDCNARTDEKILAMRSVYGLEGYAMFFMIAEIMREQNDHKLEMNKYIWSTLAMQMHTDASKVQKFVEDCINEFQLFVLKDEFLYSESLIKRMNLLLRYLCLEFLLRDIFQPTRMDSRAVWLTL